MESWRIVWRDGFAPVISTKGLEALRDALKGNDPRLLQGDITTPPPLMSVEDWPVEATDAIGFTGWKGNPELTTVGEVVEHFAKCCLEADRRLGGPAARGRFLDWWDDNPREEVFKDLLVEVEFELRKRSGEHEKELRMDSGILPEGHPNQDTPYL